MHSHWLKLLFVYRETGSMYLCLFIFNYGEKHVPFPQNFGYFLYGRLEVYPATSKHKFACESRKVKEVSTPHELQRFLR